MDLIPVLAGCAGALLIWCALKNKHPVDTIQKALKGEGIAGARPLAVMPYGDVGSLLGDIIPGSYTPGATDAVPGAVPGQIPGIGSVPSGGLVA